MQTVDFSRSFLTFCTDWTKKPSCTASHKPPYTLNAARIRLECVCTIEDAQGYREDFSLGASCKAEVVGAKRDLWLQPNADFIPIYGRTKFMNLKTYAQVGQSIDFYPQKSEKQPERQVGVIAEAFDDGGVEIVYAKGELLQSAQEVVEATLANDSLVATTRLSTPRYTVTLTYPVKTMNANQRDWVYQTDTGPVLLPDLELEPDELISGMELAFAAFNHPDWVEFIVREPVPVGAGVDVYHYARPVRWDAHNQVIRLRP